MSQQVVRLKNLYGDFWEQNPILGYMSPFNEFKKKKNSSNIMKAIYMIYDSKSPYRATSKEEGDILAEVNKNFLNDEKFPWDEYDKIISAYKDVCISKLQKKVNDLMLEISEMDIARRDLSFDDSAESERRMKMYSMVKTLYTDAITLQNELNEEVGEQLIYGDYVPSLIEEFALNG
jgi:hypothetical protein